MKFQWESFMTGLIGGSILTLMLTNPCSKNGMYGCLFIGFVIGITYEEMKRYSNILDGLETSQSIVKEKSQ
jgi:fructose-specific phosphotransferase system IIC component